ncbi:MAG: Crp/Fnr family transcriptional regulator [Mycoplasmatota bacterium]
MKAFKNIEKKEINYLLKILNAHSYTFKKNQTILTNIRKQDILGIIKYGSVDIIRVDYKGNKSVITQFNEEDLFASKMFDQNNYELSIVARSDCEIIIINNDFIKNIKSNSSYYLQFIDNIYNILINNINVNLNHLLIVTKKTIREKLLEYFKMESNKVGKKVFKLSVSFTSLADYLSVDRSSLMRELKNLKEDNIIEINNKILTLKV